MRHPSQGCRGGAGRAARRLVRYWPQVAARAKSSAARPLLVRAPPDACPGGAHTLSHSCLLSCATMYQATGTSCKANHAHQNTIGRSVSRETGGVGWPIAAMRSIFGTKLGSILQREHHHMCKFSFLFVWGEVPRGGYMTLEIFVVSARTNKRHHHPRALVGAAQEADGVRGQDLPPPGQASGAARTRRGRAALDFARAASCGQ